MRKIFVLFFLTLLASCNTPPEAYEKGIAEMGKKKWDKAIEAFNLVTEKDEGWLDSATEKKQIAFHSLLNEGEWKKIFRVLEKYRDDDDFYFHATDSIENLYFRLVEKGKADSTLALVQANKQKLIEHMDSVFVNKVVCLCEDQLFSGIWEGQGSLKGQEIYFKREGTAFHAFSNKSLSGWKKDGIIYKDLQYSGGKRWKVNPKIFQTNYWGDNSTYYSKKGSIELLCSDTLLVKYETLGNERKFSRKR